MANVVREVAILIGAGRAIPAPPPTVPSVGIPCTCRFTKGALTCYPINDRNIRLVEMRHEPIRLKLVLEKLDPSVFVVLYIFCQLSNIASGAE